MKAGLSNSAFESTERLASNIRRLVDVQNWASKNDFKIWHKVGEVLGYIQLALLELSTLEASSKCSQCTTANFYND
eukprot:IDg3303t1